jgi:hypothetical protein
MVELLFPERIAARRTELECQAALQKKRSAERFQQEGARACVRVRACVCVSNSRSSACALTVDVQHPRVVLAWHVLL